MNLKGRKALVMGAGRSGIAAAKFLSDRGAVVAFSDSKPIEEWPEGARSLKSEGIGLVPGEIPSWLLDQIDLAVLSPGVPMKSIPVRYLDRAGAEVIGEVELAFRFLKGRVVGITGSNGKTTTTTLVGEMLGNAGLKVQVGGNIGTALLTLVDTSDEDTWTVAEMSSFQLETIVDFRPSVGIALNVTPNHLDRYENFAEYASAKHRLFENQTEGDVAILNADDEIVDSWATGLKAHVVRFSVKKELSEGVFLRRGNEVVSRTERGEKILFNREEIGLKGLHNVENVLAAVCAALACGADPESIRRSVRGFRPVEHRLEFVREIDDIRFYNDSKATSVDAAVKALDAFAGDEGKVVLIMGGKGKKASYAPLAELVKKKVRELVLIGEDAQTIENELGMYAKVQHAESMLQAVEMSRAAAERGDVVLLAPACASFDMFKSFEHRGQIFKESVRSLEDVSGISGKDRTA